jgi:hypothetical protein
MDVVVLNEVSNMPDREKQFLSGKNHYAIYKYKKLKHANPALGYLRVVNHQYLNRTAEFFLSSY